MIAAVAVAICICFVLWLLAPLLEALFRFLAAAIVIGVWGIAWVYAIGATLQSLQPSLPWWLQ